MIKYVATDHFGRKSNMSCTNNPYVFQKLISVMNIGNQHFYSSELQVSHAQGITSESKCIGLMLGHVFPLPPLSLFVNNDLNVIL